MGPPGPSGDVESESESEHHCVLFVGRSISHGVSQLAPNSSGHEAGAAGTMPVGSTQNGELDATDVHSSAYLDGDSESESTGGNIFHDRNFAIDRPRVSARREVPDNNPRNRITHWQLAGSQYHQKAAAASLAWDITHTQCATH
jgi:hypothetical protein